MDKYLIIIIFIIVFSLLLYNNKENITTSDSGKTLSDEALQNIAKLYGDTTNMATFNNINVTAWKGMVSMWTGTKDKIPSGWALCDGTQGTPDLRGRFVLGFNDSADINYGKTDKPGYVAAINTGARAGGVLCNQIGTTGGEVKHIQTIEEMPKHSHNINLQGNNNDNHTNFRWGGEFTGTTYQTDTAGQDYGFSVLPPYLVLCYIMKL